MRRDHGVRFGLRRQKHPHPRSCLTSSVQHCRLAVRMDCRRLRLFYATLDTRANPVAKKSRRVSHPHVVSMARGKKKKTFLDWPNKGVCLQSFTHSSEKERVDGAGACRRSSRATSSPAPFAFIGHERSNPCLYAAPKYRPLDDAVRLSRPSPPSSCRGRVEGSSHFDTPSWFG